MAEWWKRAKISLSLSLTNNEYISTKEKRTIRKKWNWEKKKWEKWKKILRKTLHILLDSIVQKETEKSSASVFYIKEFCMNLSSLTYFSVYIFFVCKVEWVQEKVKVSKCTFPALSMLPTHSKTKTIQILTGFTQVFFFLAWVQFTTEMFPIINGTCSHY